MSSLPETTSQRGLVVGLVLGLPMVAYGVRGALVDADDTHPAELAAWIVGSALVNDLALIPLALAAGVVARRLTPRVAWPAVRTGLMVTGVLGLVAWPFVRGYGQDPRIPSLLDRNYAAGLAVAVAAVWTTVAAWSVRTAWAAASARRGTRQARGPRGAVRRWRGGPPS